jgi:hypothetical protein
MTYDLILPILKIPEKKLQYGCEPCRLLFLLILILNEGEKKVQECGEWRSAVRTPSSTPHLTECSSEGGTRKVLCILQ